MLTYVTMERIMIPMERKKGGKQMEDKGKMQINEIREDAAEFAEILVKVPKTRKKDAEIFLKGFAACASIKEDKSA